MNHFNDQDPFARDEPDQPACDDRSKAADGMVVHGFLALLHPSEALRIQRRVDRAIATIRRENKRFRLNINRRIAWISGSVGIAAAIVFAIFLVPSTSDSQAFAAFQSIRSSTRLGGRTYAVRMEIDPVLDNRLSARPDNAQGDTTADRPRPQPQFRMGELVMGSGGRWTLAIFGAAQPQFQPQFQPQSQVQTQTPNAVADNQDRRINRPKMIFGCNGTTYWAVGPTGELRTAASIRELRPPMLLGAFDAAWEDDGDGIEPLTLDSMLEHLERGYDITFEQASVTAQTDQRPVTIVSARKQPRAGRLIGPKSVRIVADAQTFVVLKAQWEWTDFGGQYNNSNRESAAPGDQVTLKEAPARLTGQKMGVIAKKRMTLTLEESLGGALESTQFSDLRFEAAPHVQAATRMAAPQGFGVQPVPPVTPSAASPLSPR